jgi:hypothetical protein
MFRSQDCDAFLQGRAFCETVTASSRMSCNAVTVAVRDARRLCPPSFRSRPITGSIPTIDLQKPDGLVVITKDDLPDVLLGLELPSARAGTGLANQ